MNTVVKEDSFQNIDVWRYENDKGFRIVSIDSEYVAFYNINDGDGIGYYNSVCVNIANEKLNINKIYYNTIKFACILDNSFKILGISNSFIEGCVEVKYTYNSIIFYELYFDDDFTSGKLIQPIEIDGVTKFECTPYFSILHEGFFNIFSSTLDEKNREDVITFKVNNKKIIIL